VRTAPSVSVANALASAIRSWLLREILRILRAPKMTGTTASGMAISAQAASLGLVTNNITMAPTAVMLLRSAIDMTLPMMLRISSTSEVSRETSSPLRVRS
jgi:hypothetical protein